MDVANGPQGVDRGGRNQFDVGRRDGGPLQRNVDPAHANSHDARSKARWRRGQHRDRHAGEICAETIETFMTLPRQTLSYLRNLLADRGIEPKNKLGQNFLIDLNLLDLVVRTANLSKEDLAFEVGSGTGTLTGRLAEAAGAVVSVEIDPQFFELASELLSNRPNVRLVKADVLKHKNELNP